MRTCCFYGKCNKKNIKSIADYYVKNEEAFKKISKAVSKGKDIVYPQMRILDMCFCTTGKRNPIENQ